MQDEVRQDPDAELVEAARRAPEGDTRAFEKLVDRHQQLVLTNCRHLSRSEDDAEDLAQEVFLKAYFGIHRFEGRASFKSWVQRIKLNHCLNHLRKKKNRGEDVELDDAEATGHAAMVVGGSDVVTRLSKEQRIARVLDSLPDTLRVPLLLCDLDGLEYSEIAQNLGIGLSATKMRIKRGREEFQRRYREISGEGSEASQ